MTTPVAVTKLEVESFASPDEIRSLAIPTPSPRGHEAWVEGCEGFVGIEVLSAGQYAKS